MIYLASPYSHADAEVREARFRAACRKTADLTRDGQIVYSPIVHSHPLALLGLPCDWPFWQTHNREMLEVCSALVVLQLPGWEESRGVQAEIKIARLLTLPVRLDSPTGDGTVS